MKKRLIGPWRITDERREAVYLRAVLTAAQLGQTFTEYLFNALEEKNDRGQGARPESG